MRSPLDLSGAEAAECPRNEESLQDSVSTLVKTSSWGTGTTTSTTSGNSTRLLTSRATRMTLFFEEILFSNFLTNNIIDQFIIVVK